MMLLSDVQVITRRTPTSFEPVVVNPERLGETVDQSKREWRYHPRESSFTATSTAANLAHLHVASPSLVVENVAQFAAAWKTIDWESINRNPVASSTRATTLTATTVHFLRSLLRMQLRDDYLRSMSPEHRAIYEWIRKLRDETRSIDFDVVESLRELRESVQLSEDLAAFCSRQGILPYLPIALDLVKACFSSVRELHLQLEQDPETGEEWLVLDVTIQGDEEKILDAYSQYVDQWISAVPWPERHKIRLSYNII